MLKNSYIVFKNVPWTSKILCSFGRVYKFCLCEVTFLASRTEKFQKILNFETPYKKVERCKLPAGDMISNYYKFNIRYF